MSLLQIASKKLVWAIMPSGRGSPATSWPIENCFIPSSPMSAFFGAGKLLPPTETFRGIFCRLPFRPKDRTFFVSFFVGPKFEPRSWKHAKKSGSQLATPPPPRKKGDNKTPEL